MADALTLLMSGASLAVSATTAYLTLWRSGCVTMTRPTVFVFTSTPGAGPKLIMRALLRSTAHRGNVIEGLYVRVHRHEGWQNFNIWLYGEKQVARGSGLFVGKDGVVFNHHFMPPRDAADFRFSPGEYTVEVYVTLPEEKRQLVRTQVLSLSAEHAKYIEEGTPIYYEWGPDAGRYFPHPRELRGQVQPDEGWSLKDGVIFRMIPQEGDSVTFRASQTNVILSIGIRNILPVPVTPRKLLLRWDILSGSYHANDLKEVVDEFPEIAPGEEYPIRVPLNLSSFQGQVTEIASTQVSATLLASVEDDKTQRAEFYSFTWAKVRDERG